MTEIKVTIDVWERVYDSDPGNSKPNKFLGTFELVEQIEPNEGYDGLWIGSMNGDLYVVKEFEISGMYDPAEGGSKFQIKRLSNVMEKTK